MIPVPQISPESSSDSYLAFPSLSPVCPKTGASGGSPLTAIRSTSSDSPQTLPRKRSLNPIVPLRSSFDKIPTSKSIEAIESFDAKFEEHARRFAARLGLPSESSHVPFKYLMQSIDNTVRNSISKPPYMSPFSDTKIVIFCDTYEGKLPSNGLKQSEFNQLEGFYKRLTENQTLVKIEGSPYFKANILKLVRLILSQEVGRDFFIQRLCKHQGKKLTIKPTTPTFSANSTVPNEKYNEVTVYFSFEEVQVTSRAKEGQFYPSPAPFDSVLFHELIHANHMFKATSDEEFKKKVKTTPVYGKDFENCEEECTIGYFKPGTQNAKSWKHRSITENDFRSTHPSKLPLRYGHHGISKPPAVLNIDDVETKYYFYQACEEGYEEIVRSILNLGMHPDTLYNPELKHTPLFAAAKNGRLSVVLLLLAFGANAKFQTDNKLTLAHYCVKSGDVSMIMYLLKDHINIFHSDLNPTPLIPYAIKHLKERSWGMVEFLQSQGASFFRFSDEGTTALHEAAGLSDATVFTKVLAFNKNIYQPNIEGLTPMHFAFMAGNLEVIQAHFTEEHLKDRIGQTTWLHYAALNSSITLANFLISKDPAFFLNDPFNTLMDFALQSETTDINSKRRFVLFLLEHGIKIEKIHSQLFVTLFATASQEMRMDAFFRAFLIINIDDPVCCGKTLLSWAVCEGDTELASFALHNGAKINPKPTAEQPDTPLHEAVRRNDNEMVQRLLFWSADKFAKNLAGETVLETAMDLLNKDSTFDPEIYLSLQKNLEEENYRVSKASKIVFSPSVDKLFETMFEPTVETEVKAVPPVVKEDEKSSSDIKRSVSFRSDDPPSNDLG